MLCGPIHLLQTIFVKPNTVFHLPTQLKYTGHKTKLGITRHQPGTSILIPMHLVLALAFSLRKSLPRSSLAMKELNLSRPTLPVTGHPKQIFLTTQSEPKPDSPPPHSLHLPLQPVADFFPDSLQECANQIPHISTSSPNGTLLLFPQFATPRVTMATLKRSKWANLPLSAIPTPHSNLIMAPVQHVSTRIATL